MKKIYILLIVLCLLMCNNTIVYAYADNDTKSDLIVADSIVEKSIINYEQVVEDNWESLWKNKHIKSTFSLDDENSEIVETCTLDDNVIFVNDNSEKLSAKTVLYALGSSGSKKETDYDSVYTIKGYVTIYYTTVDVAGTTCRRLTKVSGGI